MVKEKTIFKAEYSLITKSKTKVYADTKPNRDIGFLKINFNRNREYYETTK